MGSGPERLEMWRGSMVEMGYRRQYNELFVFGDMGVVDMYR
jgi:hypothetical protein